MARRWSGFVWLAAAISLAGGWALVRPGEYVLAADVFKGLSFAALAICCAEHARRSVESAGQAKHLLSRVMCTAGKDRRVRMAIEIDTPYSPQELWAKVSDLPRFLTIDPFHEKIVLMRPAAAAGVHLVLWHNAWGCRFPRFGRILFWREGRGFAFSDLSRAGKKRGFPHVFFVSIDPLPGDPSRSRLRIDVRGRWTSRWIPPWIGQHWVSQVCKDHARLLSKGL